MITKAEVVTALAAMRRNRELTGPKYQQAVEDFKERWKSFDVAEATPQVIEAAFEVGASYKIKGCDAFHVGSALIDHWSF